MSFQIKNLITREEVPLPIALPCGLCHKNYASYCLHNLVGDFVVYACDSCAEDEDTPFSNSVEFSKNQELTECTYSLE